MESVSSCSPTESNSNNTAWPRSSWSLHTAGSDGRAAKNLQGKGKTLLKKPIDERTRDGSFASIDTRGGTTWRHRHLMPTVVLPTTSNRYDTPKYFTRPYYQYPPFTGGHPPQCHQQAPQPIQLHSNENRAVNHGGSVYGNGTTGVTTAQESIE